MAVGKSNNGLIGGFEHVGLAGTLDQVVGSEGHQIPTLAFAMFQLTFAIITVALALAIVLGKRDGFKKDSMRPRNLPLVLLGAGSWCCWHDGL